MLVRALLALLAFAGVATATALAPSGDTPTAEEARRLFDRGRWEQAAEAYRKLVAADPQDGLAWFRLAYSLHQEGDLGGAIEANQKGLENGSPRGITLYNLACAYELTGDVDRAEATLREAIGAGYLDFDSIRTDPDLAQVRARRNVELPEPHAFQELRGRNGVVIPYELLLPEGYESERSYPALVLFGPGNGPLAASWALENLCGGITREQGCIVLLVVAPERGWWTHPTHHALEDLLKKVRKEHSIAGNRFHLVGFLAGAHPASTYASMSRTYFSSFTAIGGAPFPRSDDRSLARNKGLRFLFLIGEGDRAGTQETRRIQGVLDGAGAETHLRVLAGETGSLPGLHQGRWLELLAGELGLNAD